MSAKLGELPELPLPPREMRGLVGTEDPRLFDNPARALVYPYLSHDTFDAVFDFGCGCGRIARQLIQQIPQPRCYLGIDLHRGMIEWCRKNLTPHAPAFEFAHHDVFHVSLNPGDGKPMTLPFPAPDRSFTLVEATSVFTHLVESQAGYYMREVARILADGGVLHSTWFLFGKSEYPMLSDIQNALYTNEYDLSAAVLFDREWVRRTAREAGLSIIGVTPPEIRNFQWRVVMTPTRPGVEEVPFPVDTAPRGHMPGQPMPSEASRIGLEEQ